VKSGQDGCDGELWCHLETGSQLVAKTCSHRRPDLAKLVSRQYIENYWKLSKTTENCCQLCSQRRRRPGKTDLSGRSRWCEMGFSIFQPQPQINCKNSTTTASSTSVMTHRTHSQKATFQLNAQRLQSKIAWLVSNCKQIKQWIISNGCWLSRKSMINTLHSSPINISMSSTVNVLLLKTSKVKKIHYSAVLATAIPSARLSHTGIVSKRRHVARCSLHCWIAKCV